MRLLDLFSGAGGAAMGYHRAGFEVVGVDNRPMPRYPFEFHQADALEFVRAHGEEFDVIHASPPCQAFTAYARRPSHVGEHPDLIAATRRALREERKPYVIENISAAPLQRTLMLCGSSFGLDVRRHRYFESNLLILETHCQHRWQTPRFPQATNRQNPRRTVEVGAWRVAHLAADAMGIDWMNNEELSQAIPPAYTQYIGEQLMWHLREVA